VCQDKTKAEVAEVPHSQDRQEELMAVEAEVSKEIKKWVLIISEVVKPK
jgi:hypothetical protein